MKLAGQQQEMRSLIKAIYEEQWTEAFRLGASLESAGIAVGVIKPSWDESGKTALVDRIATIQSNHRKKLHGKARMGLVLQEGNSSSKSLRRKLRAATKRDVDCVLNRPHRSTISTIATGQMFPWHALTAAQTRCNIAILSWISKEN